MAIALTTPVARNETLLFTDLDDTVVMMDVDEGRYYEFDPIGAKIWTLLETARTAAELCEILAATYDVEPEVCRRDVLEFLNEIEDMKIVRVDRGSAGKPATREEMFGASSRGSRRRGESVHALDEEAR